MFRRWFRRSLVLLAVLLLAAAVAAWVYTHQALPVTQGVPSRGVPATP